MAPRAVVAVSAVVISLGVAWSSSAGAAPHGERGSGSLSAAAPAPPVPIDRGEAIEHRPTTQQLRRAEQLSGAPLQREAQPIQSIRPASAAETVPDARPVRLTSNGAWSWYSDPRVLETSWATYFAYVTRGGSVMLTSLSATDARMETTVLSRYQLSDDHNVPALVVTADGRVVAFWGGHGKAPVQYRVSGPQGTISAMSAVRRLEGSGMEDVTTTYVQAFRMRGVSNQYHLLTRRHSDQNWVLTTSKDLVTWTKPLQLFKNSDTVDHTWPYLEAASAGWKQMHLAVSDGHPVQDHDNSLYHFTFDAATKALRRSDGSWVARPAYPRSGTLVYDGRSLDGRVRVYDLALRGSSPTVAFTTVDRSPDTPGYTYKWATLWGSAWQTRTLARQEEYPEGVSLDSSDATTAYVVTREGEVTQLSELRTADGGVTWRARPVAAQTGAQRTPTTPFGTGGQYSVMWMAGPYADWTDYRTSLVGESTGPTPISLTASWPSSWASGDGVSARIRAGIGGPDVEGITAWLLVKRPGQPQQYVRSATTDSTGTVHLAINRYYPKGTTVWVFAPAAGDWGAGKSQGRRT